MSNKKIVLDFDGTITQLDVGDEICDRFAPPEWRDIDACWHRGEISLPEAQRRFWALTRATRDQMQRHARQTGALRPGIAEFVQRAKARGHRVSIASGGFDFYIHALIAPFADLIDDVICNSAVFDGDRMTPVFNDRGFSCPACAVCKGRACQSARAGTAAHVIFVGDGSSDRCVLGCPSLTGPGPAADSVVAIAGSALAAACREHEIPHRTVTDFRELFDLL